MTGIRDVAREVGMSTASVSRALRGLPGVSPATRHRVLEAARRLGYVASPQAAGLASGTTRTIGVVVPFVTRWYFSWIVQGAQDRLRGEGYDLLLYNLGGEESARERLLATRYLAKRVDALLVLALTPTPEEQENLRSWDLPVGLVGAEAPGFCCVDIDDVGVSAQAVDHLVELGHERIAYVGGGLEDTLDHRAPRLRAEGWRAAMARHGLPLLPGYDEVGDFTMAGGERAGERLMELADPPTAIYAASDEMAIGVLRALRRAGRRTPQDVSVMGVDDHEMASFLDLTTVAQPVYEQGEAITAMLLAALRGELAAESPAGSPTNQGSATRRTFPTTLVVRSSTAPPGGTG